MRSLRLSFLGASVLSVCAEAAALRNYLLGGGFLMIDDLWGDEQWASLMTQLVRVFPDCPVIDLPTDHEIFRAFYPITGRPAVPGVAELMGRWESTSSLMR